MIEHHDTWQVGKQHQVRTEEDGLDGGKGMKNLVRLRCKNFDESPRKESRFVLSGSANAERNKKPDVTQRTKRTNPLESQLESSIRQDGLDRQQRADSLGLAGENRNSKKEKEKLCTFQKLM